MPYCPIAPRVVAPTLLLWLLSVAGVEAVAQCPELGYDRASLNPCYVERSWDTAVTCLQPSLLLIPTYTVTAATLNGQYAVDTIPYNPPDTTFCSTSGGGRQIPITLDDNFHTSMLLPFPFHFFGIDYRHVVVGANGILTFDTTESGRACEFQYSAFCPIPNRQFPHKNAIYGVYEDIDPSTTAHSVPNAGIYQSIYGHYPCRKLCVSYNGIAPYGRNASHYSAYQIACYEGTNIIEVHVKRRDSIGSITNEGAGLIGIQDRDGERAFVARPRHAAPDRYNPFTNVAITEEAFRFTPLGDTLLSFDWYRGSDTLAANKIYSGADDPGNDTLILVQERLNNGGNRGGTEVYADSRLQINHITTTQHITARLRFVGAGKDSTGNNLNYDLKYTFLIGVDKESDLQLVAQHPTACRGDNNSIVLEADSCPSDIYTTTWHFTDADYNPQSESRIRNLLVPQGDSPDGEPFSRSFTLIPYPWQQRDTARADTVMVTTTALLTNGCKVNDTAMLVYVNNRDTVCDTFFCANETFHYGDGTFAQAGSYNLGAVTELLGCPRHLRLNLTAHDTHYTIHYHTDCRPYTWHGTTYNEATHTPCIHLVNRWGCDSIVNLHFDLDQSLQARIEVSPDHATLTHTEITFRDISHNSDRRIWLMPDGSHRYDAVTRYTFPLDCDSITTRLIAIDPWGCQDSTEVTVPLHKESIWFPNVFTPELATNNRFLVKGTGILSFHIEIYDRNGTLVARWAGLDGAWDGTDLHGLLCPNGTYIYLAKYSHAISPRAMQHKRGTITLLR